MSKRISHMTETITPEIAAKYLEGNTHNRPVRDSRVERYASDMKSGHWRFTHQGIAFDVNGTLIDGQHRLFAILMAGVSIKMLVTRNLPLDTQAFIDDSITRTVADVMKLDDPNARINNYLVATARYMHKGNRVSAPYTRHELIDFFEKHEKAIRFAVETVFQKRKVHRVMPATVAAVISRATYHEPHERLKELGSVILDGMPGGAHDVAAILLRNWLLQGAIDRGAIRVAKDSLIYRKTQRAVQAFCTKETVKILMAAQDEIYPIPGEDRRSLRKLKLNPKK